MTKHRGFTLIELMIVVAIIAILGAIAISQCKDCQLDASGGTCDVTFGGYANGAIAGQHLTYSPITHAGSIEWVCNQSNPLALKYVPNVCQN